MSGKGLFASFRCLRWLRERMVSGQAGLNHRGAGDGCAVRLRAAWWRDQPQWTPRLVTA